MIKLSSSLWHLVKLLPIVSTCLIIATLFTVQGILAQECPPGCPDPVYGYQPYPSTIAYYFDKASRNQLGAFKMGCRGGSCTRPGRPQGIAPTTGFEYTHIFYPPSGMEGKIGAAVARNNSSNLIALLHERRELGQVQYMTYNGVPKTASMTTSYRSHVPILYRYYDGWQSSIQVQNIESQFNNFVTVGFFDQDGNEILFVGDWIPANRSRTFYLPSITDLGANYVGSAVVEGHRVVDYPGSTVDRKVIAIANVQDFLMADDRGGGYNGFNR